MSGAVFLLQCDANALAMEWFNGIASVIYKLVCNSTTTLMALVLSGFRLSC